MTRVTIARPRRTPAHALRKLYAYRILMVVVVAVFTPMSQFRMIPSPALLTPDNVVIRHTEKAVVVENATPLKDATAPPEAPDRTVVPVFYNVYVHHKNTNKIALAKDIVQEQMAQLRPEHKVYVRSIGSPIDVGGDDDATILRHDETGSELETLELLWQHCLEHTDDTVVYIHNKGSLHPSEQNDMLRKFLTRGALSKECSAMPSTCDICSSRMSPIPHPHTSGNMWVAKCDYVQKLMNPQELGSQMTSIYSDLPESFCLGTGRYAAEHWIHSHPSARPCDLSTDGNYTWNYEGVPEGDFEMALEPAPRFEEGRYLKNGACKRKVRFMIMRTGMYNIRMSEYQALYNETPGESWWGWNFYNTTYEQHVRQTTVAKL